MELQILAALLLILRIITVKYLLAVIGTQRKLLRYKVVDGNTEVTDSKVLSFRKYLHYMTVALLMGNIPAIILDVAVLMGETRTTPYLVIYAAANALTTLIAVLIIFNMYKLAGESKELHEFEKSQISKIKE